MNLTNHFNSRYIPYRGYRVALLIGVMATLSAGTIGSVFALDPAPDGGYLNRVTAEGEGALFSATTGTDDTAIGYQALYSSAGGLGSNTAVGSMALHNNTTGYANVAIGFQPMAGNTTGIFNEAIGENALIANTTGGYNVAIGEEALQAHQAPFDNVAIGSGAMSLGTQGEYNVAIGATAMAFGNGNENVAVGDGAMNVANGSFNVALGQSAGLKFAGNSNIAIGQFAGQNVTNGSNNIEIANQGAKKDSAVIRLGDTAKQRQTFIAGISGVTVASGVGVVIGTNGQLGTITSSARYKEAIKPMAKSSEAILSLEPVTFRYKKELDPAAIPQFGLVAEDVAKIDPELVVRDEEGQPCTVRYEAVNAMLLNEFLKEHRKVETQSEEIGSQRNQIREQQGEIGELRAAMSEMKAALEAQGAQIQKVSAQLESTKSAVRLVSTNE